MAISKEVKEQKAREREWQAQDDARIMAQYQEILNDKSRMSRALKEAQKQANAMKKVANKKGK